MSLTVASDRKSHWIKRNHQCRVPKRWVAFDTEAYAEYVDGAEVQRWQMGAAVRWRTDLTTGDHAQMSTFDSPLALWQWVADFCRPGVRTVVVAHNLGYDVRIADVFNILPTLGFEIEWCNLDRNVSAMTWRGPKGTIVFADTWTWLPTDLHSIAPSVGLTKLRMPGAKAQRWQWEQYCLRDAEIVYRVMSDIIDYIKTNDLGNWQPTGAGMAYATWRHKFMSHNILVHDDIDALTAERAAMHTGRAEAWRHGRLEPDVWTEVDMRNAYVTIASECELPTKLKMQTGRLDGKQYGKLSSIFRVLAHCAITTDTPVVPHHTGTKTLWPVGTFQTWLWDTELDMAIECGATVKILKTYCYTKQPILQDWAKWVLGLIDKDNESASPVVRTWAKHCGRALIGRLSLRSPRWEIYGSNPTGHTGMTIEYDADTGKCHRLMSVGNRTLIETDRVEGRDSLPQVTGWIMAECRVRLWRAVRAAGESEVAHLDTDSLIVSRAGLRALRAAEQATWRSHWQAKGSWRRLIVYGPRNYRCGTLRKVAGVPRKATEVAPNEFVGEKWHGLSSDMMDGRVNRVTISPGEWQMTKSDPRRCDAPGVASRTVPYEVYSDGTLAVSSASRSGIGE